MRLIDADAFKEYLRKGAEANADIIPQRLVDAVLDIMDGIMLDIDEQPTIDAVPATIDGALGYLHKVGWIQEHDRIMTEDVAPVRHGHWIKNDPHCDGLAFLWNCSECGGESDEGYRYCPACGARMDGDEKNCDTCKHRDKGWYDASCDGCTKAYSNWERRDDE